MEPPLSLMPQSSAQQVLDMGARKGVGLQALQTASGDRGGEGEMKANSKQLKN